MRILLFGTFDILHPGHLFVFQEAKKRGDVWIVIARDRNVEKLKGKTAVHVEEERKRRVEEVFPEAHVILGDSSDFFAPVRTLKPDLILFGYDQKLPPGISEADFLCPIERLPAYKPQEHKSSLLRQKGLQKRDN